MALPPRHAHATQPVPIPNGNKTAPLSEGTMPPPDQQQSSQKQLNVFPLFLLQKKTCSSSYFYMKTSKNRLSQLCIEGSEEKAAYFSCTHITRHTQRHFHTPIFSSPASLEGSQSYCITNENWPPKIKYLTAMTPTTNECNVDTDPNST